MTRLIAMATLAGLLGLAGCGQRGGIKSLPLNNKPLSEKERERANDIVWQSDSTVVSDSEEIVCQRLVQTSDTTGYLMADSTYRPLCRAYVATWGRLVTFNGGDYFGLEVDIDGVDEVTEPGRWWRLVRETINRLAAANAIRNAGWMAVWRREQFAHDSIRLFKLDSTMRAIGR